MRIEKKRAPREAQTLVFFMIALGAIILLCGLAIDSGLLYLAKARMGRAVDGAALIAVGNFHQSDDPLTNRNSVALLIRNFAVINYGDLGPISTTATISSSTYTLPNGQTGTIYKYNFNDATQDPNGQFRRFVEADLTTGAGGEIVSATCNARCPVTTYFIGFSGSFKDLKVSSSAIATRNPRLIMVVVDRSSSMLANATPSPGNPAGGAYGLPQAIVTFLNFFDTTSDYIGIVSFGGNARLEMGLTTNFLNTGTNVLYDTYQTNLENGNQGLAEYGIPGVDPEAYTDPNYATGGVRRMKFGGETAADEGIRLGLETLMADPGFNNPDVLKYMVVFTDGAWNTARTLVAAPGYTNVVSVPTLAQDPNAQYTATNTVLVPCLSSQKGVLGAIAFPAVESSPATLFSADVDDHTNDWFQSVDTSGWEPIYDDSTKHATAGIEGSPQTVSTNSFVVAAGGKNVYTTKLDVWLQPGAVDYVTTNGVNTVLSTYVSDYTNPSQEVSVTLLPGQANELVVPGYVADAVLYDGLDLAYYDDNATGGASAYPRYRSNNYLEAYMWNDVPDADVGVNATYPSGADQSTERKLMYRNYANLLSGYFIMKPDDPMGTNDSTGVTQPLHGLGPYYPSAGFYWPFDLAGLDYDPTYSLRDGTFDDDSLHTGHARHITYSYNMLATNAAPEWYGELFYEGQNNVLSGTSTTAASTLLTTLGEWQNNAPDFVKNNFISVTTTEAAHNTNIGPVVVWRPASFNGSSSAATTLASVAPNDSLNKTGGYVSDGAGHYYRNAMAYSGRPTHYFNFATSQWQPIQNNHVTKQAAYNLCYWKAQEYAWHGRALGVTFYTVGYGGLVTPAQQVILAQVANATNTTAGSNVTFPNGTAINFNPQQPIGQQFYATTPGEISNDFYQVGQAINAALTQ